MESFDFSTKILMSLISEIYYTLTELPILSFYTLYYWHTKFVFSCQNLCTGTLISISERYENVF